MEKIRTWQERTGNHNIRPGSVKHMIAEIADLRAALARAGSAAPTGQQAEPVTCRGCDPAEGFCRACREAERAALAAPTAAEGPSTPVMFAAKRIDNGEYGAWIHSSRERAETHLMHNGPAAPKYKIVEMVERAAPLPTKEGAGEVDAKDAGPVISSYDIEKVKALKSRFVESLIHGGVQYRTCGAISAVLNGIIADSERAAQPKDTTDTRRDANA